MIHDVIPISEAARILGVSVQTLRRWDKSGKFQPSFISPGKHRFYARADIEKFSKNLFSVARAWVSATVGEPPALGFYCPTSAEFQGRLSRFELMISRIPDLKEGEKFSLVSSVVAEIGDNPFVHNLGKWPDIPGTFFGYDEHKRQVVIADRGLGVYTTLKTAKPGLRDDKDALKVAFTEFISGRTPEKRGNGLKHVRTVISKSNLDLVFQSGDAILTLHRHSDVMHFKNSAEPFRGTLALIDF